MSQQQSLDLGPTWDLRKKKPPFLLQSNFLSAESIAASTATTQEIELSQSPGLYLAPTNKHRNFLHYKELQGLSQFVKADFANPDQIEVFEAYKHRIDLARKANKGLNFVLDAATGHGKTFDSIIFAPLALKEHCLSPSNFERINCKILFLLQSKILVDQFEKEIGEFLHFPENRIFKLYESNLSQEQRLKAWHAEGTAIILATYQTAENDLVGRPLGNQKYEQPSTSLRDSNIKLVVIDEGHNSSKNHAAARNSLLAATAQEQQAFKLDRVIMSGTLAGNFADSNPRNAKRRIEFKEANRTSKADIFIAGKPNPPADVQVHEKIIECSLDQNQIRSLSQLSLLSRKISFNICESMEEIASDSRLDLTNLRQMLTRMSGRLNADFSRIPSRAELEEFKVSIRKLELQLRKDNSACKGQAYKISLAIETLEYLKLLHAFLSSSPPYTFFSQYSSAILELFKIRNHSEESKEKRNSTAHLQRKHLKILYQPEIAQIFHIYAMSEVLDSLRHYASANAIIGSYAKNDFEPFLAIEEIKNDLFSIYNLFKKTEDPKTQAWLDACLSFAPQIRSLTCCRYRSTAQYLCKKLQEQGLPAELFIGGENSKSERHELLNNLERFRSGEILFAVGTFALMGTGVNVPGIQKMLFFDTPLSWEEHTQAKGRAGRSKGEQISHDLTYLTVNNDRRSELSSLQKILALSQKEAIRRVKRVNDRRAALSQPDLFTI
jgi:ERCC4-related helicase